MPGIMEFETPENVQVRYQNAGLGSRFVAWFVDSMLLGVIMFVLALFLLIAGLGMGTLFEDIGRSFSKATPGQPPQLPMYLWGVMMLIMGAGSFLYFGLSEVFMRGQTIGKRQVGIRVVKTNGFSLDLPSILLRNVFRMADNIPLLWIVPFVSKNSQRLGDMVAGTAVVKDEIGSLSVLRQVLLHRPPADAMFRFNGPTLARARPGDAEAVEKILERWAELSAAKRNMLLQKVCVPLAERLKMDPPPLEERRRFLEEFLAAEFRRQHRKLD